MATRKNRKSRGRKRGGGEGEKEAVTTMANVKPTEPVAEPVAQPVVAANTDKKEGAAVPVNASSEGGKRKTRKGGRRISRGASKWNQFVMRTFKEMRKKNKDVKLMDAMKECSKQKKKGMKY